MPEPEIRKIVFVTGTRADFGKLKSLIHKMQADETFEIHIFVTGMHMLTKYGVTCKEVEKAGFSNIFKFINQNNSDSMDHILSKTISGLSDYLKEVAPDLLVIHGDRVEALAGASVGALNNILTSHIEGGEVSGTVDEMIRHAVTKLSHFHFVSNSQARERLVQLGEPEETIHVIGSPDIDIMNSSSLPSIFEVKSHYGIDFDSYAILMFHPVTSEYADMRFQISTVVDQIVASGLNYILIYPNNDYGTDIIIEEYSRLGNLPNIKIFPSMRFEYFLTLLKNSYFIIGNSSAGVREAPHFGVPAINLGSRQNNRVKCKSVLNVSIDPESISHAIALAHQMPRQPSTMFGSGNSAERFHSILKNPSFWKRDTQKYFVDRVIK